MGSAGDEQTALQNCILHTPSHLDLGLEPEKFREAVQNLMDLDIDKHKNVGKRQAYPDGKPGNSFHTFYKLVSLRWLYRYLDFTKADSFYIFQGGFDFTSVFSRIISNCFTILAIFA